MINKYQNIWLKLNELALIKKWSTYFDKDFYNLFKANEDYTCYEVDLYKFTTLNEKTEGLEHTPKMIKYMKYLGEVILAAIPEIALQEKEIQINIKKNKEKGNYIYFFKEYPNKFNIF